MNCFSFNCKEEEKGVLSIGEFDKADDGGDSGNMIGGVCGG